MGDLERLTDVLIVCTRHRPDEVAGCLESVQRQTRVPDDVLVVDSSDDARTRTVVEAAVSAWPSGSKLRYVHSDPALSHQRQVGIDATTSDVVHFVDDDVRLDAPYVAAVMEQFELDREPEVGQARRVVGVGGYMVGQGPRRVKLFDMIVGLDSDIEGVVLASGRNIPVVTEPTRSVDVQWLSGAAMSYRRESLRQQPPDPRRYPFEGEDVDLSFRIGSLGRLVVTPWARYEHRESQQNRVAGAAQARAELVARLTRVRQHPQELSMRRALIAAVAQCVKYALSGLVTLSPRRLAIARGTAQGLLAAREQS